jgi:opine dehydrogenase
VAGQRVVVVGAGPDALLLGGCLTLEGHEVVLLDVRAGGEAGGTGPVREVRLVTASGDHDACLAGVTTDPFEALGTSDVVLVGTPPHALAAVMALVLPLVEPRHTLVFLPGGLSGLACATWLRDRGRVDLPAMVVGDAAPFHGRLLADGRLEVLATTAMPGLGVFPAGRTGEVWPVLAGLLPGAHVYPHALAAALASPVPFLRALAAVLGGAPATAAGETSFTRGFTRDVARAAVALDAERLLLGAALGLELTAAPQTLHRWGLAPLGDLWATVHGSFVLTTAGLGDAPQQDQLADDVRYFLRPVAELADALGVPAPLTRSLVTLTAALDGRGDDGWSLNELGLDGMAVGGLAGYLESGILDA